MRLIDADALKEQVCLDGDCTKCKTGVNENVCKWNMVQLNDVVERLESAPTIEAVLVVRCKDCKHRIKWNDSFGCAFWGYYGDEFADGEMFCGKGERKDDD